MKHIRTVTGVIFLLLATCMLVSSPVTAAESTIDGTANTSSASMKTKPDLVFVSSTVGYMFYRDSDSRCVYSKTTDGGANWGAAVQVSSLTSCQMQTVWYDQWTPGSSGTIVHIVFIDSSSDDVFYDYVDTNGDVAGTQVAMDQTAGNTFTNADIMSITRGSDGDLYIGFCDGSAAAACNVKKCTGTCTTAGNWTAAGAATPLDIANDYIRLLPLASGNIMLLRDDVSADDIQSRIYTDASNTWAAGWTTIDASAVESATYQETLVATVDKTTNDIYLAYGGSVAGASTADIRTAVYTSGGGWALKTDVATNQNTIVALDIAIDDLSKDIYVAYAQGIAGVSENALYKKSLDGMGTWSSATQYNTATGDIRLVFLNMITGNKLFGAYYRNGAVNDDILGNTIADLSAVDPTWITGGADFKIYQSSSLVWDSGTLICSGTLSDTNGNTISCASDGIQNSTQYRVQIVLKNGGGTTMKMNGSGDYIDHALTKAGWAGTSPSLGSCGFNDLGADNGSTSCSVAFSGNDVRVTNTGAGNVAVQAAASEGFAYLITTDSDIPTSHATNYLNANIDGVTEDSSKITINKFVIVSITVADGTVTYGLVPLSSSQNTTSSGTNDTQEIGNNGTATVTLNIRGQDTACPWSISGSPGSAAYSHLFCKTGSGSPDVCDTGPTWTALTTSNQTLSTGLAPAGTFRFDLMIQTPTATSCYSQQTTDVTILAVQE
jgi:hypothetical protein